jgi:prophage regulatory protein
MQKNLVIGLGNATGVTQQSIRGPLTHAKSPFSTFTEVSPSAKPLVILRCNPSAKKLGISRTTFLEKQNPKSRYFDSTMPRKIRLGMRTVGWLEADLDGWLLKQIARSTGGAA